MNTPRRPLPENAKGKMARGPDGSIMTLNDLPPPGTTRWLPRQKAMVMLAVEQELITLQKVCERYSLTEEEFNLWQIAYHANGLPELRTTVLSDYRNIVPAVTLSSAGFLPDDIYNDNEKGNRTMRVLLVEDDAATAQSIELMLKSESFNVYTTDLGEEAIDLGKLYDYDIILLDLNLPDMSGYEVLRTLRAAKVQTPIMIVSGLAGIEDKVRGLGFGADDYMTKPFHKDELVARMHAIIRRSKGHAQSVIQTGEITVNLDTKTVEISGQRMHVTSKEYQMLELLSLRKGTTLTKEMFLNHLYGGMDEPELKIVDVFICKLRRRISRATGGKNYIETVWGRGYMLREPEQTEAVAESVA